MKLKDIQPNQCFHYIFGLSCERHAMLIESAGQALASYVKQTGDKTKKGALEAILSVAFNEEERLCLMHTFSPIVHQIATVGVENMMMEVISNRPNHQGEDRIIN